jgi:uncharacterized membrane protein YbhN (UPF0104 family)
MTQDAHFKLVSKLKPGRIVIPILIGLAIVGWFIIKEINSDALSTLKFTWKSVFWLFVAWCCMIGRDLGYMIRIRILTENDLTWRQAFRVIMLWEFTSAITPSTVGGTAVDILFTTSFAGTGTSFLNNLVYVAIIGYTIILAWVIFVGYGLFFNPDGIRKTLIYFFKLPVLRRWKGSAVKAGEDIVESSHELKKQPFSFWVKAFTATFLSWTSRYWVVNAILVAFFAINKHFLIFARQLVTWIMMIISPTPGGSGFAEVILGRYISDAIPVDPGYVASIALAMAIIWRIISYYPYLIIGASIIPGWIHRKFIKPPAIKK